MRVLCLLVLVTGCSGGGGGGVPADLSEVEPNDSPATSQDLGALIAILIDGRIERTAPGPVAAGDLDTFRFVAPVHGVLEARLELPAAADYDLALLDAAGVRKATARADNRDAQVGNVERLFAPVTAGEVYFVEVGGFGGAAGEYRLRLAIVPDPAPGPATPAASFTTALPPLPTARSFHAAVATHDGGALLAGGATDVSSPTAALLSAIDSTDRFDPAANVFAAGPSLGTGRFGLTATPLPTGRVLLAGGDLLASADLYDPHVGAMAATLIGMTGGIRILPTATLLPDGRVLLAGGTSVVFSPLPVQQTSDSTTIFDPKTRAFTPGPTLLVPRTSHASVCLPDGRVLVTGGVGHATSEILDPVAGTSVPGPALNGVRDDHTATLLKNGSVLLAGGQDATNRSLDSAEILDPGTSAFRLLAATMQNRRADHQAMRLPTGQVLLFGGEDDPGGGADVLLGTRRSPHRATARRPHPRDRRRRRPGPKRRHRRGLYRALNPPPSIRCRTDHQLVQVHVIVGRSRLRVHGVFRVVFGDHHQVPENTPLDETPLVHNTAPPGARRCTRRCAAA